MGCANSLQDAFVSASRLQGDSELPLDRYVAGSPQSAANILAMHGFVVLGVQHTVADSDLDALKDVMIEEAQRKEAYWQQGRCSLTSAHAIGNPAYWPFLSCTVLHALDKAPGVQKKRAMLINAHVSKTASYGTRVDSSKVVDHTACTGKTESRAKK